MGDSVEATVGVGSTIRTVRDVDEVIEAGASGVVLHVYDSGALRVSFGTVVSSREVQYLRWTIPADAYEVMEDADPVTVDTDIAIAD